MFLELPFGRAELAEACRAVVRASGLARGYLRAFAFFGDGTMGLGATNPVRVAVAAWEAPAAHAPVALRVASFGHGAAWLPGAKIAGQYARAFLARREAQATGCDDALFLGADGTVAEATGANVFIVRGGAIETPPLGAPVLAGITRASVLALAGDAGIAAHERPVRRDDVIAADEAFLTSSSAEIVAVRSFEGRALRAPGRVTSLLAERLLSAATGRDDRHRDWLEHVE
jgi:branched-chain amino acid aminotransferase